MKNTSSKDSKNIHQITMRIIRLLPLSGIVLCACLVHTNKKPGDIVIPYPYAKDSFLMRITDMASNASPGDTIHFVYYADESLKSGKETEEMIKKYRNELLKKNYVFVGFAHFGLFRPKRRRDFIPPSVKTEIGYKGQSGDYGQADSFYSFLKDKIIPLAEEKFKGHNIQRSFMGHSLSGLFAVYLFANSDSLFQNLYALSPALWIDDYHVLNYENSRQGNLKGTKKYLWISCGGDETINRIKDGVTRISDTLNKRKYPDVHYEIKIYKGESHNSSVGPALQDIFPTW
jgi:predicted alpha/beta superfamily hydrolase